MGQTHVEGTLEKVFIRLSTERCGELVRGRGQVNSYFFGCRKLGRCRGQASSLFLGSLFKQPCKNLKSNSRQ